MEPLDLGPAAEPGEASTAKRRNPKTEHEPPFKRRRHYHGVDCARYLYINDTPELTAHSHETAEHVMCLFREIERHTGPGRDRRIIELIYYLLARPTILLERPLFTQAIVQRVLVWISTADREIAVLGAMSSLQADTIMPSQFQSQIVTVTHYEHIRDCGLRLVMTAKDILKMIARRTTQAEYAAAQAEARAEAQADARAEVKPDIAEIVANVMATLP